MFHLWSGGSRRHRCRRGGGGGISRDHRGPLQRHEVVSPPPPRQPRLHPLAHEPDRCGARCALLDAAGAAVVLDDTEPLPDHLEDVDPGTARLRKVADMLARGMTRAEIATRYHVHVDTVTAWTRTIREKGINRVRATTAEGIIAALLHSNAQRTHLLWQTAQDAQARGVHRTVIRALDALRKEDQHVFEIAKSLGALEHFTIAARKTAETEDERFCRFMSAEAGRILDIEDVVNALRAEGVTVDLSTMDPQASFDRLLARVNADRPDEDETDEDEEPLF